MAEFTEVMRQYNRLCAEYRSGRHEKYCNECPVSSVLNGKNATCTEVMRSDPEWFEKTVMDWAAEHPEPVYPTWREWQNSMFPDAHKFVKPCEFGRRDRFNCVDNITCVECMEQQIPADIAEKLGIKPKEV